MLLSGVSTWTLDAIGEEGTIHICNDNDGAEFELWRMEHAVEGAKATPVRHTFPRPQRIWSAGVGQVKNAITCIETGKMSNCSGEMGILPSLYANHTGIATFVLICCSPTEACISAPRKRCVARYRVHWRIPTVHSHQIYWPRSRGVRGLVEGIPDQ